MNDEIICYVDMFAINQKVTIGDKTLTVATHELGKILPSLCYSEHSDTIHLFGNEKYIEGIAYEIYENKDYSNIQVKVN